MPTKPTGQYDAATDISRLARELENLCPIFTISSLRSGLFPPIDQVFSERPQTKTGGQPFKQRRESTPGTMRRLLRNSVPLSLLLACMLLSGQASALPLFGFHPPLLATGVPVASRPLPTENGALSMLASSSMTGIRPGLGKVGGLAKADPQFVGQSPTAGSDSKLPTTAPKAPEAPVERPVSPDWAAYREEYRAVDAQLMAGWEADINRPKIEAAAKAKAKQERRDRYHAVHSPMHAAQHPK